MRPLSRRLFSATHAAPPSGSPDSAAQPRQHERAVGGLEDGDDAEDDVDREGPDQRASASHRVGEHAPDDGADHHSDECDGTCEEKMKPRCRSDGRIFDACCVLSGYV